MFKLVEVGGGDDGFGVGDVSLAIFGAGTDDDKVAAIIDILVGVVPDGSFAGRVDGHHAHGVDAALHGFEEGIGVNAAPEDEDDKDSDESDFPRFEVFEAGEIGVERPIEHLPKHVEEVGGGKDDSGSGEDREGDVEAVLSGGGGHKSAVEGEEFADESVHAWESDAGEHDDEEEGTKDGHLGFESAVIFKGAGVGSFVDESDEEEEGSGADSVGELLECSAHHSGLVEAKDSEDDESHVGDGAVGDQLFDIGLDSGDDGPVDDADDAEDHDGEDSGLGGFGKEGKGESQESESSHFEEDSGEDD